MCSRRSCVIARKSFFGLRMCVTHRIPRGPGRAHRTKHNKRLRMQKISRRAEEDLENSMTS